MANATNDLTRRFRSWHGGLVLSLLGAFLVVVGSLQTTSSHPTSSCPSGSELIAKFNFEGGSYVFEKPAGNEGVVTITNGSATGGDMHSTIPISVIIVKGGPDAVMETFSPPQTDAHFSNAGLPPVGSGNIPDISNVQFCGGDTTPTTTTEASTTTTEASTTTTEASTTSTEASTTSTEAPTTTTGEQVTTTTERPVTTTTTTQPAVTTTAPSTSTTQPAVTTTAPSTTQPSAATTTTVAQEPPVVTSTTLLGGGSSGGSLPTTGAPSVPLMALGVALIVVGLTLTVVGRARDRRASS